MADGNTNSGGVSFGAIAGGILLLGGAVLALHNKDAIWGAIKKEADRNDPKPGGDPKPSAPDNAPPSGTAPDATSPIGNMAPPDGGGGKRKHNPPGMWRTWPAGTAVTLEVHSGGKPGVQRWTVGQSGRPETKVGAWEPMTPDMQKEADASENAGQLVPKAGPSGASSPGAPPQGAAPTGTPSSGPGTATSAVSPLASLVGGGGAASPGSGATSPGAPPMGAVMGLLGAASGGSGASDADPGAGAPSGDAGGTPDDSGSSPDAGGEA